MQREWDFESDSEEPLVTEPESFMLNLMEVPHEALMAVMKAAKVAAKASGVPQPHPLPHASLVGVPGGMPDAPMQTAWKLVTEGVARMGRRVMPTAFYMGGDDMLDNMVFVTGPFLLHVFVRILASYPKMHIPSPFLEPLASWRPVAGDDINYADVVFYRLCLRLLMARKCTATMPSLPWAAADLAPTYRSPVKSNRGDGVRETRDYRAVTDDNCVVMMDTYTALMRELDELTIAVSSAVAVAP